MNRHTHANDDESVLSLASRAPLSTPSTSLSHPCAPTMLASSTCPRSTSGASCCSSGSAMSRLVASPRRLPAARSRCPAAAAAPDRRPPGGPSTDWASRPPPADYYTQTPRTAGGGGGPPGGDNNNNNNSNSDPPLTNLTKAFIAGAFVMGMGAGVWFNTGATFTPSNVASTELIDRKTPNSEVCLANGYSSMVFDQRIFVSFNPFNVYVTQPEVKPGCVVRRANIGLLEKRGLVSGDEVRACTRNMNTFAFVGDLTGSPEVACVYHSEDAENQFLRDPKRSVMGDGSRAAE